MNERNTVSTERPASGLFKLHMKDEEFIERTSSRGKAAKRGGQGIRGSGAARRDSPLHAKSISWVDCHCRWFAAGLKPHLLHRYSWRTERSRGGF